MVEDPGDAVGAERRGHADRATVLEKLDELATACADDDAPLCQGIQPANGRLFLCPRHQSDKLSSRCRSAVSL